jgi:hypothetical protein
LKRIEQLSKILHNLYQVNLTVDAAKIQIIELFGVNASLQEEPVLIGHLNRDIGYHGL